MVHCPMSNCLINIKQQKLQLNGWIIPAMLIHCTEKDNVLFYCLIDYFLEILTSNNTKCVNMNIRICEYCQQFYFSSLKLFLVKNNYLAKLQLTSI